VVVGRWYRTPPYPRTPFPYVVRQRPGPRNALGAIKFVFANPHLVLLHDTPSQELFEQTDRSFSSGCMRVEHPFELAELLLERDGQVWNRPMFDEGSTFYRDVYGRDASVLRALDAGFVYVPPRGMPERRPASAAAAT